MSNDLLIRNVRPMGRDAADVLVIDGTISGHCQTKLA